MRRNNDGTQEETGATGSVELDQTEPEETDALDRWPEDEEDDRNPPAEEGEETQQTQDQETAPEATAETDAETASETADDDQPQFLTPPQAPQRPVFADADDEAFWDEFNQRPRETFMRAVNEAVAYREQLQAVTNHHYQAQVRKMPRFFDAYGGKVQQALMQIPAEQRVTEDAVLLSIAAAIMEDGKASGSIAKALARAARLAQPEEQGTKPREPVPPPPTPAARPPSPSGASAPARPTTQRERGKVAGGTDAASAFASLAGVEDPLQKLAIAGEVHYRPARNREF